MKQALYNHPVQCRFPLILVERVKAQAAREGSTVSEFMRTAVREKLASRNGLKEAC